MSSAVVKQKLGQIEGNPGEAIPPELVNLVFGLITQIVSSCRKTGQSTEQVAKAIKSGEKAAYFRRKLRNKMGPSNYKLRGGSKYAAKIVAAGTELKLQEAREFVNEWAPA
jgi:hypothetical protein